MFKIYWTEDNASKHQDFQREEMSLALARCEVLRVRQRNGEAISFITLCSENPDSVTRPGVDVTGPGYDWKKRRN